MKSVIAVPNEEATCIKSSYQIMHQGLRLRIEELEFDQLNDLKLNSFFSDAANFDFQFAIFDSRCVV